MSHDHPVKQVQSTNQESAQYLEVDLGGGHKTLVRLKISDLEMGEELVIFDHSSQIANFVEPQFGIEDIQCQISQEQFPNGLTDTADQSLISTGN